MSHRRPSERRHSRSRSIETRRRRRSQDRSRESITQRKRARSRSPSPRRQAEAVYYKNGTTKPPNGALTANDFEQSIEALINRAVRTFFLGIYTINPFPPLTLATEWAEEAWFSECTRARRCFGHADNVRIVRVVMYFSRFDAHQDYNYSPSDHQSSTISSLTHLHSHTYVRQRTLWPCTRRFNGLYARSSQHHQARSIEGR